MHCLHNEVFCHTPNGSVIFVDILSGFRWFQRWNWLKLIWVVFDHTCYHVLVISLFPHPTDLFYLLTFWPKSVDPNVRQLLANVSVWNDIFRSLYLIASLLVCWLYGDISLCFGLSILARTQSSSLCNSELCISRGGCWNPTWCQILRRSWETFPHLRPEGRCCHPWHVAGVATRFVRTSRRLTTGWELL